MRHSMSREATTPVNGIEAHHGDVSGLNSSLVTFSCTTPYACDNRYMFYCVAERCSYVATPRTLQVGFSTASMGSRTTTRNSGL
jgi:hypothetical protein